MQLYFVLNYLFSDSFRKITNYLISLFTYHPLLIDSHNITPTLYPFPSLPLPLPCPSPSPSISFSLSLFISLISLFQRNHLYYYSLFQFYILFSLIHAHKKFNLFTPTYCAINYFSFSMIFFTFIIKIFKFIRMLFF